jgi:hypothetical protein
LAGTKGPVGDVGVVQNILSLAFDSFHCYTEEEMKMSLNLEGVPSEYKVTKYETRGYDSPDRWVEVEYKGHLIGTFGAGKYYHSQILRFIKEHQENPIVKEECKFCKGKGYREVKK